MDLRLRGLSGFAACRSLRDLPARSRTRFIAPSGHDSRDYIDAAREAGFYDYFVRPVGIEALERVLASMPRD